MIPKATSHICVYDLSSIICFEATKNGTKVYFLNGTQEYLKNSLYEIEKMYSKKNIIRVHHSYLINSNKIIKYISGNGGYLDLGLGFYVPVSRKYKIEMIMYLNDLYQL